MKRLILAIVLTLAVMPVLAPAQEPEKKGEAHETHESDGSLTIWKWVNFAILAGGLGYMIGKNAGPYFTGRSAAIRKDIEESMRQQKEAEARVAEVERRLATLESEIAAIRDESEQEINTGAERLASQSAEEIAKIRTHASQEIASAGKQARFELKRYSAELAMGLAEQRVRTRMTDATQDALVDGFVSDLK